MDPINKTPAIASKLNTLLRMGLVSKNNVRRAITLFNDPEKAMKNPSYRLLMQELLVDVVDRVLNNKMLYTALRSSLAKEPTTVIESIQSERKKTLLRSGLVKKKDVLAARRALESPEKAKNMSAVKVYRDMMITMLDSMVNKITGSPKLFNAFKQTLGNQPIEESFETPNPESMEMFWLLEDAQELLEKNKPTNPKLWAQAKAAAKKKFDVYPSAYANGWAVKHYNEKGGGWKSANEGKTFFGLRAELNEAGRDYITKMPRMVIRPKEPTEAEKEAAEDKKRALRAKFKGQKAQKKAVDEGYGVLALGAAAAMAMKRQREAEKRRAQERRKQEDDARRRDVERQQTGKGQ